MLKDYSYFLSIILSPFVTVFVSIVTMRFVEPELIGYYQTSQLILMYLSFLHLGVYSGLARQYPIAIGKDLDGHADAILSSVGYFTNLIALAGSIIVLIIVLIMYLNGAKPLLLVTIGITIIISFLSTKTTFLDVVFRVRQLFSGYGNIILTQNLMNIITTILPMAFGYIGLLIKTIIYVSLSYIIRARKTDIPGKNSFDMGVLFTLARIGLPILASTYLYQIMFSLDRTVLALFVDMRSLGNYAISAHISAVFLAIVGGVSAYFTPKAIVESTNSIRSNYGYLYKSVILCSVLIIPGIVIGYLYIGAFIDFFIPEYHGAIEAAKVTLLSGFSYILLTGSFVFVVLKKTGIYILMLVCVIILYACGTYILIGMYGITSIESLAWIKLVVIALFSIALMLTALSYIYRFQHEKLIQ
jgi:O-antigen/teichoic acid export membrane protein